MDHQLHDSVEIHRTIQSDQIRRTMLGQAHVLRLEDQLTVPTRDRIHLVDLWFSLGRNAGLEKWAREFATIADGHNSTPRASGILQLVPMSERGGWIVARGVDLTRVSRREMETLVGKLVAGVNARCVEATEAAVERQKPTRSWPERVRASMETGGSILGALLPVGRPRTVIDSAPTS